MMKGITVILYERTPTGESDAFNRETWTEKAVPVQNVLVSPITQAGAELLETLNLKGRKADYMLGIPKGDTHEWEGCRVAFFGRDWQVIGKPTEGIEHLIPGAWNRKVEVEAIE